LERKGKPLGELTIMSIENPTLAHFRHFNSLFTYLPAYKAAVIYVPISHLSSACPVRVLFTLMGSSPLYICRESSTNQLILCKTNPISERQMNIIPYNTKDYENKSNWTLGQNKPIQTQSNPISEKPK